MCCYWKPERRIREKDGSVGVYRDEGLEGRIGVHKQREVWEIDRRGLRCIGEKRRIRQ